MTYDQLVAFIAVVDEGGFKSASKSLHLSQPAVSVAIKKLEDEFDISFFSREAYRPQITVAGKAFYDAALVAVRQMQKLETLGQYLGKGAEPEISIALVDACPAEFTLGLLKNFFSSHQSTKLKLKVEGVRGALERVLTDEAELGITPLQPGFDDIESIELGCVQLVPVCSPDYPLAKSNKESGENLLQDCVQVIQKDTSTQFDDSSFGVVKGASSSCTVNDSQSKKLIIKEGLGWGSLPDHMIVDELANGQLVKIKWLEASYPTIRICVVRKKSRAMGPVAEELWGHFREICTDKALF